MREQGDNTELAVVLARLAELERRLDERNTRLRDTIDKQGNKIDDLDCRLRDVEISSAKLFTMITGGGTIGGAVTAIVMVIAKAAGLF